jgi:putative SOS response-associated peptidase YedK
MCGRYRLARKKEILAGIFDTGNDADWAPCYNVAPGQDVRVIRQDPTRPVRFLSLMPWGLIPSWATDHKAGYKMINARAETVADKPAFRELLQSRRCLIPADAFYEWAKDGEAKLPHCFARADDSVFAFAGLWDRWPNPEGDVLSTCSIITTTANALVSGITRPDARHPGARELRSLARSGIQENRTPPRSAETLLAPIHAKLASRAPREFRYE